MKNILLSSFLILGIISLSHSQKRENPGCGSDELHQKLLKENVEYKKRFDKNNEEWQKYAKKIELEKSSLQRSIITQNQGLIALNVVFHDMTNSNTVTATTFTETITRLNTVFNEANITFCLTQRNLDGNNYTGTQLNHITNITSLNNNDGAEITQIVNSSGSQAPNNFPATNYINIYVVNDITGPVAGFAFMPSSHGTHNDGIYIEKQWLLNTNPSDINVLAHEMGHYLGLFHVFGICDTNLPAGTLATACSCTNTNPLFNGDMVADTPPSLLITTGYTCDTTTFPNTCNPLDAHDDKSNYMDYSPQDCQNHFTDGQINRMHFMIDPVFGVRKSLLGNSACESCLDFNTCHFDITPNTALNINHEIEQENDTTPPIVFNATPNCTFNTITYNWSLVLLGQSNLNVDILQNSPIYTLNSALAVGNYQLTMVATNSNLITCSETDIYNFTIIPTPVAQTNCSLQLPQNNTDWNAWNRSTYTGGWTRDNVNNFPFHYPVTVRSVASDTNFDNNAFDIIAPNDVNNDPNFTGVPNTLPVTIDRIMRVGRIINDAPLNPGNAHYASTTFHPTAENCKFRIYYLGMRQSTQSSPFIYKDYNLFDSVNSSTTTFGFMNQYNFHSNANPTANLNTIIGMSENGNIINNTLRRSDLFTYGLNDMFSGVVHDSGTYIVTNTSGIPQSRMTHWAFRDLDFSEFIGSDITITFFDHSNNAENSLLSSYAYYGIECLGGGIPADVILDIPDVHLNCGQSIYEFTLRDKPINIISSVQNGGNTFSNWLNSENNLVQLNIFRIDGSNLIPVTYSQQPFFSTATQTIDYRIRLNIDSFNQAPFQDFRVEYITLNKTIIDTFRVYTHFISPAICSGFNGNIGGIIPQGVNNHMVFCPTNNNLPTLSFDLPQCLIDATAGQNLTYQWFIDDITPIPGATNASYQVKLEDITRSQCSQRFSRRVRVNDPYCNGNSIIYFSDTYTLYNTNNNIVFNIANWNDLCFNDNNNFNLNLTNIGFNNSCRDINIMPLTQNSTLTFQLIDRNTFPNRPLGNPITINVTENAAGNIQVSSNAINLVFTNLISQNEHFFSPGDHPITIHITGNLFNCPFEFDKGIIHLIIRESAVGGRINFSCSNPNGGIINEDLGITNPPNQYGWQFSLTHNGPFVDINGSSNSNLSAPEIASLNLPFPLFFRRVSFGNQTCSDPDFSNVVQINDAPLACPTFNQITAICQGDFLVPLPLISIEGIEGTWTPPINNNVTTIYTFTPNNVATASPTTMTIIVNPIPVIDNFTFVPPNYCGNGSIRLIATATNNATINWFLAQTGGVSLGNNIQVTPLVTTTYWVQATNTTCTSPRIPFEIVVRPMINNTFLPICEGGNLPEHSIQNIYGTWSPSTLNNIPNQLYTFTPLGGQQCSDRPMVQFTITPRPSVSITVNCENQHAILTAIPNLPGNYNYAWSVPSTNITNPGNTASFTTSTSGNYSVIITNTDTGCISNAAVQTIENFVVPTFNPIAPICAGSSLQPLPTISLQNISGTWSPGLDNLVTTTYTFTPDPEQCATTTSLTITVNPPIASPTITSPITYTLGDIAIPLTPSGSNLLWYTAASGVGSNTPPIPDTTFLGDTSYFVSQTIDGCESPLAEIVVHVDNQCSIATTWTGTSWTNGIPDLTTSVIINGDYDMTTQPSFDACSVIVNSPFKVTVTANHYVKIQNSLVVRNLTAGNIAEFNVLNDGSLVQINNAATNSGNIEYTRTGNAALLDYIYWSSPINNFNTDNVSASTKIIWDPVAFNDNSLTFGSQGNWADITDGTIMDVGKGYAFRRSNNPNASTSTNPFTINFNGGIPNNGIITTPITRGDYNTSVFVSPINNATLYPSDDNLNFIGNPYPSSINASDFLIQNTNIEGYIGLWSHGSAINSAYQNPFYGSEVYNYTASDYLLWNLTGLLAGPINPITGVSANQLFSFNGYIAGGQGFFVEMRDSTSPTESVTFNNQMRYDANQNTYDNTNFFRLNQTNTANANTNTPDEKNRIWLDIIDSSNNAMRTLIGYVTGATYAKDRLYDVKTYPLTGLDIFENVDNESFTVNGRPVPFDNNDQVSIGVTIPSNGTYKIGIYAVDGLFGGNQNIYLEDMLLHTFHDLKAAPYTFTSDSGKIDNRFRIVYKLPTPTFNPIAPVCYRSTMQPLPTTSLENIAGTWSPTLNNLVTTTYTFTPTNSQFQSTTITITVLPSFIYFADSDGDGYGNPNNKIISCEVTPPTGYVAISNDCDDTNSTVHPGAVEICYDGIDNDCNGIIDNIGLPGGCSAIITSLTTTFCNKVVSSLNATISAIAINGVQGYRFKVTNQTTNLEQIVDSATNSLALSTITNMTYSTEYSVEIALKFNDVWQPYGSTCYITTPAFPTTQMICPTSILATIDTYIVANLNSNANGYRFEVTNMSTQQTTYIDNTIRQFKLTSITSPSFTTYNTQYSIKVAVLVNGVAGDYSTQCIVTTPNIPVNQIACPTAVLATINSNISALNITYFLVNGYRFEVTNLATGEIEHIESTTRQFKLTSIVSSNPTNPFATFNTQYKVKVAMLVDGVSGAYGPECIVTTPNIPVTQISCPTSTLLTLETNISAVNTTYSSINSYLFEVTNLATGQIGYIENASRTFILTNITNVSPVLNTPFATYNTQYKVKVAMIANGNMGAYSPECIITTPPFPTTKIQASHCGITIAYFSSSIYADYNTKATGYRFRMYNAAGYNQTVDKPTRVLVVNSFTGLQSGTTYNVDVSLLINGVWGPYGSVCTITTPGATSVTKLLNGNNQLHIKDLVATLSPNPSESEFTLKVKSPKKEPIQVKVYDLVGKYLESFDITNEDINEHKLGSRYPSGMYTIVITQGDITKTLKAVKK